MATVREANEAAFHVEPDERAFHVEPVARVRHRIAQRRGVVVLRGDVAVSAKGRRRIVVDGARYLWWVVPDLEDDFCGTLVLTVASADRKVLVRYGLVQSQGREYVIVLGPRFRSHPVGRGPWRRFRCPRFVADAAVTPRDVARFIRWCVEPGEVPEQVDYYWTIASP
ncbi:MAG: hypothetical protein WKG00_19635 [Polyangiaceae bacterium]